METDKRIGMNVKRNTMPCKRIVVFVGFIVLLLFLSSCQNFGGAGTDTKKNTGGADTSVTEKIHEPCTVTPDPNGGTCSETEFVVSYGGSHPLPTSKGKGCFFSDGIILAYLWGKRYLGLIIPMLYGALRMI